MSPDFTLSKLLLQILVLPEEMVRDFFNYWSEPNKSRSKMRYELQNTWDTSRRLATWSSKDNQFKNNNNGTSRTANTTAEERTSDAARNIASFILNDPD